MQFVDQANAQRGLVVCPAAAAFHELGPLKYCRGQTSACLLGRACKLKHWLNEVHPLVLRLPRYLRAFGFQIRLPT